MQELVELFQMVSLNDVALNSRERLSVLKAKLALRMFERAINTLKAEFAGTPVAADTTIPAQVLNASVQTV